MPPLDGIRILDLKTSFGEHTADILSQLVP
jgi:hypothetical protein